MKTWLPCLLALGACAETYEIDPLSDEPLHFAPSRPPRDPPGSTPAFEGADPIVREAQARFPTALDLHAKVIRRSCSPDEGVCHNTKEYPDLHTAGNFLSAISAPCNIQAGTREGIFDRCERPGDRFQLATTAVTSGPLEIGQIHLIPGEKPDYSRENLPTADSPGLHVVLADPIRTDRVEVWTGGRFIRTFVEAGLVRDIAYQTYTTRWWVLDGGRRLVGEVNNWQRDEVSRLMEVGVIEGDPNMNGVFGARAGAPIALIVPGSPEESYLIGRLRGVLEGEEVPGTRMPLANQPLSNSEMLALFCFIEGLRGAPSRLDLPIDYVACTYSRNPTNLDVYGPTAEITWTGRVQTILQLNCAGCHDADRPSGDLPLVGPDLYDLLTAEGAAPGGLRYIEPGAPERSYLWLKLVNDPTIQGSPMPSSPISGWRPLPSAELEAIRTWIADGASPD